MRENSYKPVKKTTLFGWLAQGLRLNHTLRKRLSTYYSYRLFYFFFLGLLYIWNAHYHERMVYRINQLQPIVDGLRVKYMGLQSSYMLYSKQSEVAKRVAPLGIYESTIPPYTIKANRSSNTSFTNK